MKRDTTIREELKEIAPFLASLEKKNLLKVPEGYFEENTRKLIEAALIEEKVRGIKKIAGKRPLATVPKNYFENLPTTIINRVNNKDGIKVISIERRLSWKQWLQVAAAIAAIVIMGLPLLQNHFIKQETIDTALNKVSDDELNSYLSERTVTLSEDDLAKHISDAKLEQATSNIITEHAGKFDENIIDLSQLDANDIQNL